jgi:Arc/MetJ family transcription regulator
MDKTIEIDDALVKAAQELTGEADARAAVEKVLRNAAATDRRPIDGMLDLVGKVRLRDDYDYKAMRADDHDPN